MKVLQINAVNKVSSTGRTTFEMNEFLNNSGHSCVTAYSKGESFNPEKEFIIGDTLDTKIHGLLSRISGMQGYFSHFATKKLLKFMHAYTPDIVVIRNLHGNYINLPLLLKYLAKKDIITVIVLHDCWFFTGKCCHYTLQGCYKWQNVCGNCPQLKKYNKSWFFDRTKKMLYDKKELLGNINHLAVVGVSNWILNEAKQSSVLKKASKFEKIYNWIDTDLFSPKATDELREKLGLNSDKIIISVAGYWNKEKGIDTILQISRNFKDNEKYILIGNVGDLSLPENIINIPSVDSAQELAKYYSLADVFVQPSLEETFGKVTAEALSCGTPVVCFDSTANPELAGEGCGYVADKGDIGDMIAKIRLVLNEEKSFFSNKCRFFAKNNFDKQQNLQNYLKLFTELLGDK